MLRDLLATGGVEETLELRTSNAAISVGVMALHGGLESETAEMAREVADAANASLYTVVQPDDHRWHIPSVEYDPRQSSRLARFLSAVDVAFSFHGFGRPGLESAVLLGGSNRYLAGLAGHALDRSGADRAVTRLRSIPRKLRGLHPLNPVNLPLLGGVQVELGPDARAGQQRAAVVAAMSTAVRRARTSVGLPD